MLAPQLVKSIFQFVCFFVGIEKAKNIWQRANGRQIGPMKVFLSMVGKVGEAYGVPGGGVGLA